MSGHSAIVLGERSKTRAISAWLPKYSIASDLCMKSILVGIPTKCKPLRAIYPFRHSERPFGENGRMQKNVIREVFARNVRTALDNSKTLKNQSELAQKAGMSHSHLSEVLRGMSSPTIDLVSTLALALGLQPWELLADSEATRQAAMARMLWREGTANEKVFEHFGSPPTLPKEEAPKPKKLPRKSRKSGGSHRGDGA